MLCLRAQRRLGHKLSSSIINNRAVGPRLNVLQQSRLLRSKVEKDPAAEEKKQAQAAILLRTPNTKEPNPGPPTSFEVPVISLLTGEAVGQIELKKEIFGAPVRIDLIHRVVVWKLACRRLGTAKRKNRSEVSGTSQKLARQKGRGAARIGTRRTPPRRGGGHAFPPRQRDFSYTLPKKIRRQGLASALASKFAQRKIMIVENFDLPTWKTKALNKILIQNGLKNAYFVDGAERTPYFFLASDNISSIKYATQNKANVYDILKYDVLVLNQITLQHFYDRIAGILPPISKRAARLKKKRARDAERRQKKLATTAAQATE